MTITSFSEIKVSDHTETFTLPSITVIHTGIWLGISCLLKWSSIFTKSTVKRHFRLRVELVGVPSRPTQVTFYDKI